MSNKPNKKVFQLQLNEIHEADDPTKVEATFIILDFDISHNNTIIAKEDAISSLSPSIINKPIVAKYNSPEEANDGTDHFEGHNPYLDENREGDLTIKMDTTPIGVFTTEGYITEVNTEDGVKEVLAADAILWKDRFEDAVSLLMEWYNNGININTSCEILYQNYEVRDGVEHIKSPIWFSGHAVLNSEERGDYPVIKPAYDTSKLVSFNELKEFNRLVAQAMNQNKKEEHTLDMFKKVFELSHDDIRAKLYKVIDAQLESSQYSWIRDVYDDYVIVDIESYTEEDGYKVETVKVGYSKSEGDEVSVDFESKTPVMEKREWVELEEVKTLQAELEQKEEDIKVLQNEKDVLAQEKQNIEKEFNTATETITSLNATIEELKPIKEQYETEQYEKALNEKIEYYSEKFKALNAMDKFESEEVKELVEKSVKDESAMVQLNSMLVDLVVAKQEQDNKDQIIVQHNQQREDLIPKSTDFDSRYQ